ncbi:hypothetical protein PVAP13_9KG038500 [Panicum virgatum]|uniref:Uncharacterized protein n=1 Tax=Panicum virgatum TaxID=38727 RepID=A0A8T0NCT2_PANVG|nr:hypothetical protein PVAP13_9KG038500 [Panicum virgatum]
MDHPDHHVAPPLSPSGSAPRPTRRSRTPRTPTRKPPRPSRRRVPRCTSRPSSCTSASLPWGGQDLIPHDTSRPMSTRLRTGKRVHLPAAAEHELLPATPPAPSPSASAAATTSPSCPRPPRASTACCCPARRRRRRTPSRSSLMAELESPAPSLDSLRRTAMELWQSGCWPSTTRTSGSASSRPRACGRSSSCRSTASWRCSVVCPWSTASWRNFSLCETAKRYMVNMLSCLVAGIVLLLLISMVIPCKILCRSIWPIFMFGV